MKGVSGNPALDAYSRMSVSAVSPAKAPQRPEQQAPERPVDDQAAKVSISSQARLLASSANESEVNAQRVDAVRSKLENGTLQLDTQLIANRMLDALG